MLVWRRAMCVFVGDCVLMCASCILCFFLEPGQPRTVFPVDSSGKNVISAGILLKHKLFMTLKHTRHQGPHYRKAWNPILSYFKMTFKIFDVIKTCFLTAFRGGKNISSLKSNLSFTELCYLTIFWVLNLKSWWNRCCLKFKTRWTQNVKMLWLQGFSKLLEKQQNKHWW